MSEPSEESTGGMDWELRFGITLAIFAAALAINDLGAGKFGDDEIKETNEKANAYAWYQSKGIKESVAEGQRDLIRTLLKAQVVAPDKAPELEKVANKIDEDLVRYKKDKKEILLGSATVGKDNWSQEIDGKLGQVIGAKEREQTINKLAASGDVFDFATLCLQMCMVLGAIGLLLKIPQARAANFFVVVTLGILGSLLSAWAYSLALM